MKDALELLFRPNYARWNPRAYEWYFGTRVGSTIRAREEEAVFGLLGAVMQLDHLILEAGPGTGNYTVPLAHRCKGVVAVDASCEMLGYLRERLNREGLGNVETRLGRLPERLETSRKFDGALSVGVLNYVEDLRGALRSLASTLKPGGWIVFTVPLTSVEGRIYILTELTSRRRVYLYSLEEITALAEDLGLRVEASATAGLSRSGLTLAVRAIVPAALFDEFC